MKASADTYLSQVNKGNTVRRGFLKAQWLMTLLVIPAVFWGLKLTGITMAGEAFCGMDEHVHGDTCVLQELVCKTEETPSHSHTEDCLHTVLTCTLPEQEGHTHSDNCRKSILTCSLEESLGHSHGSDCYTRQWLCDLPEESSHSHDGGCYEQTLGCGLEESEEHTHDESCMISTLVCQTPETEGHTHGSECYTDTLTCQEQESGGHTHGPDCYTLEEDYSCGLEEQQAHSHNRDCYLTVEGNYTCGLKETEGHTHTDECYRTLESCPIPEHTHTPNCYSDISADLETSADWEKPLKELIRSSFLRDNIVMIAKSQLDVRESTRNFQVDEMGIRRGITRYGQWYGNPYGDWSAIFASFCLEYAGVSDVPKNAGVEAMRLEWETAHLYTPAAEHTPVPGDLLFLDKDEDGEADSVAIVTAQASGEENEQVLFVIEGDLHEPVTQIGTVKLYPDAEPAEETPAAAEETAAETEPAADMVAETLYSMDDAAIMGYGQVPERPAPMLMMSPRAGERTYLGRTINYSSNMFTAGRSFVIYAQHNGAYYAFVSNPASGMENTVAAVPIQIDGDGNIYAEGVSANNLLWTFTRDGNSGSNYKIQNAATGRYLHPGGDNGVIYDGDWPTALVADGTGAKLRHTGSNDVAIGFDSASLIFKNVTKNQATRLYFGVNEQCTVWLDGTNGGISAVNGSSNNKESVKAGSEITLPTVWATPTKYQYALRGWYDVTHSKYYHPGEKVTITENTVFYADWMAATYDVGQYKAEVTNTVSTNSFITTHLFDYNYLFNVLSANASGSVSASSHSETWSIVQGEKVKFENRDSLNFIFLDYGSGGTLDYPNNRKDGVNQFPGSGIVTGGIYNSAIGDALFNTEDHIPGKVYLGTADHLFQLEDDPNDPDYGYYYYDSSKNAASYNQSAGRFYVYDYLEATNAEYSAAKTDFMPLNSPYANTNGQQVRTETADAAHDNKTKYVYDAKYGDSTNRVSSNYAFGMKMDISFYLPNKPGEGGNKDLYGNDLHFKFSGDDDLWVLVDGKLALDIGGIHQAETGDINFSTGEVTVQGKVNNDLSNVVKNLPPGEHTLTVMYLERGASHSNCAIYFNLAPRYGLELKKEDVLTQELLNGTKFKVYTDFECTQPAELWESEAAYHLDRADGVLDEIPEYFVVENGTAKIWGLGSGNTYYIKEVGAPSANGYGIATGLIRLTLEKDGQTTYKVDMIADADGNEPSNGFTVHGVKIDEATKTVYITATNAPTSVQHTTTVQVLKTWDDNKSHSEDYITAYLTVTDPDGTVRRIREVILSDENDWGYIWTNLPEFDYDKMTAVSYGIEESYESGYYSKVVGITNIEISRTEWAEALTFSNNDSYILKGNLGYLATNANNQLYWIADEDVAKNSPAALWTASNVGQNTVTLKNGAGLILTYNSSFSSSNRYFYATANSNNYQVLSVKDAGSGLRFYFNRNNKPYYMAQQNPSNGRISTTDRETSGAILMPMKRSIEIDLQPVENWAYEITNKPLQSGNETSFSVKKDWVIPEGYDETFYQEELVTVRLLANGVNTGRSVTLSLKNGWSSIFQGLPYKDENGNVITYTVEEIWSKNNWAITYGPIDISGSGTPTYSTTITNTYHQGGPVLPSTGTAARMLYVLCGGSMMLTSLVYGIILRRKRERRTK